MLALALGRNDMGKRFFDLIFTVPGLIILSPLLIAVALLVRWKLGSPVFFHQRRPGLHGKPFTLIKFRTMANTRDADGKLLPDSERLTRFGRFLRSTSLDEFPELLNVLKGDMSLVGPRPLLERYLPYYTVREQHRHDVRPGITGWAQVHGRNTVSWSQRLEMDVWYVERHDLFIDAYILLLTAASVFQRKGVVADPHLIMANLDEERGASPTNERSQSGA